MRSTGLTNGWSLGPHRTRAAGSCLADPEPALHPLTSRRSANPEPLVGGLAGSAESFADLFPGHAFFVASQGHVGAGEAFGSGGDAGGRDGQKEVTRVRGGIPVLSGPAPHSECELLDDLAYEGIGILVGRGRSGWATAGHGLEDTGNSEGVSGNS